MLTPITPSLVAEAWEHLPKTKWVGDHPFHQTLDDPLWGRKLEVLPQLKDDVPWLMNAHSAIKIALEKLRTLKMIGASVQANVVLSLPPKAEEVFARYADELATIFVVSSVKIKQVEFDLTDSSKFGAEFNAPGGIATAYVSQATDAKCPRCWRCVSHAKDELCERCDDVVYKNPPPGQPGVGGLEEPFRGPHDGLGRFIEKEFPFLKEVK